MNVKEAEGLNLEHNLTAKIADETEPKPKPAPIPAPAPAPTPIPTPTPTPSRSKRKPKSDSSSESASDDSSDEEAASGVEITHGFSSRKQTIIQFNKKLDYKERELALNPRVSHEVVKILQWILGYAGMVSLVLAGVGLAISQGTYMTRDEMERPVVKESFSWKFNGVIFVFATLSMYTYSIYANIGKFDRR